MKLAVKVAPKAARSAITGWMGDMLKLSVTAVPEHGKANAAVIELLAAALGLPKTALTVVQGQAAPRKLIEIRAAEHGLGEREILRRLGHPATGPAQDM